MRELKTYQDNVGDVLTADSFNSIADELENIIESSGQTLDDVNGPDTNLNQLSQAVNMYGSAGVFYADDGTANVYFLSRDTGSNLEDPEDYFVGMQILFKSLTTNTGNCDVNVAGLGLRDLVYPSGSEISASDISSNDYVWAIYNNADSRFEVLLIT